MYTSVSNFVNEATFKDVFKEVVNSEFPDKKGFYKKISMIGLDATTVMTERRKILKRFKKCEEDTNHEIVILSSWETIGEGVDTNDANMCVFVDPKSSIVKIIQNIGRIVRKQFGVDKANSTILIPCWVDKDKYSACNGVKEECDKVIREDMSAGGNFSGILNVMSALQQEQPDVYELCLNCPDTCTYNGIETNQPNSGKKCIKSNADDKKKQVNINFHSGSDVKILWNIGNWDCDLNSGIKCCLLKCEVVDVWNTNFEKLKKFIDTNNKTPSTISKNEDEKYLSSWLYTQNTNYKNRTHRMKNDIRFSTWKIFFEEYDRYLLSVDDKWNKNLENLRSFLITNKRKPVAIPSTCRTVLVIQFMDLVRD
jgi:Helicase conserved C-terminal domain